MIKLKGGVKAPTQKTQGIKNTQGRTQRPKQENRYKESKINFDYKITNTKTTDKPFAHLNFATYFPQLALHQTEEDAEKNKQSEGEVNVKSKKKNKSESETTRDSRPNSRDSQRGVNSLDSAENTKSDTSLTAKETETNPTKQTYPHDSNTTINKIFVAGGNPKKKTRKRKTKRKRSKLTYRR